MPRIALHLSYDGQGSVGWQTQPGGIALQDQLEKALAQIAGHEVATICAGRTDAGVHAVTQLVHFDSAAARSPEAWVRGVNSHLPANIAVQAAVTATDEFHARFAARRRRYHYLIYRSRNRNPLLDGRAAFVYQPLDVARIDDAAQLLVGERDFSAFRSSQCQARTPVRVMHSVQVSQYRELISIEFVANAFLHHMIRNIVGSLFQVGAGRKPVTWLGEVLESGDRTQAGGTFSASGLYLSGVDYGAALALPLWPEAPSGLLWH